jgi:MFS family permease
MMLSLSTTYYQIFLSQSICTGLGMGMIFHGAVNSVSTWFQKRRGLAIGLAASGSGIGGVIIP